MNKKTFTVNHKLQPGQLSGKLWVNYNGSNATKLISALKADLKKISKDMKYKGSQYLYVWDWRYSGAINGSGYDIALCIAYKNGNFKDYHWYRKDSNGYWSHKRGLSPITNKDASGKKIKNPSTANRNYGDYNYSNFIGTYRIYMRNVW